MKKLYLLIFIFSALYQSSIAQEAQETETREDLNICTQNLRTARSLYDEGKLNEIPKTLNTCLQRGFSSEEKVEAYRLLAITYLYLDEPAKADEAMLNLLKVNPEYMVNPELDPAEYLNLYRSFRTTWLFRAGIKLGGIYSLPQVSTFHGMSEPGQYNRGLGFQAGIFAEFDITDQIKIQPEIYYTSRSYNYSNDAYIMGEPTSEGQSASNGRLTFTRRLNYIELFAAGKYKIWETKNYYASLAPGIGYLFSAEQTDSEHQLNSVPEEFTEFSLTEIDLLNRLNPQLYIGGGTEFKFNRLYLTIDLRYGYSFAKLIVDENREALYNEGFLFVDSDHKLHSFSFTIGLMQAIYNPKKLVE